MTTDSLRAAAQQAADTIRAELELGANGFAADGWLGHLEAAERLLRAALAVPQEGEKPMLPKLGCWCLQCEEARKGSVPPESAGEPRDKQRPSQLQAWHEQQMKNDPEYAREVAALPDSQRPPFVDIGAQLRSVGIAPGKGLTMAESDREDAKLSDSQRTTPGGVPELDTCPFCGKEPRWNGTHGLEHICNHVYVQYVGLSPEGTARFWNTRATPARSSLPPDFGKLIDEYGAAIREHMWATDIESIEVARAALEAAIAALGQEKCDCGRERAKSCVGCITEERQAACGCPKCVLTPAQIDARLWDARTGRGEMNRKHWPSFDTPPESIGGRITVLPENSVTLSGSQSSRLAWLLRDIVERLPCTDVGRERYGEAVGFAHILEQREKVQAGDCGIVEAAKQPQGVDRTPASPALSLDERGIEAAMVVVDQLWPTGATRRQRIEAAITAYLSETAKNA